MVACRVIVVNRVFYQVYGEGSKKRPGIPGRSTHILAAETANLAQNLPDIAERKTHYLGLLVFVSSLEDKHIVT